jgi:hypothetical protein
MNLVTVTLHDTLDGVEVLKVDCKQDLSPEETRKCGEHNIARRRVYFKKIQLSVVTRKKRPRAENAYFVEHIQLLLVLRSRHGWKILYCRAL